MNKDLTTPEGIIESIYWAGIKKESPVKTVEKYKPILEDLARKTVFLPKLNIASFADLAIKEALDQIVGSVSVVTKLIPAIVKSKSNTKPVVFAKHMMIIIANCNLKIDQTEIANYLQMHPSSINNVIKYKLPLYQKNDEWYKTYKAIVNHIQINQKDVSEFM